MHLLSWPIFHQLHSNFTTVRTAYASEIWVQLTKDLRVSGSLNVFNHRTNVELSNRLVCFDIKQLGKQLKKLGMLIVQDQIWNRVTINRAEKKSTRYYMDEFHLLLKEEQTAAYSVEIWKRFRKWGGIPTAITQNIKDLLASREVENIFENSDFVLMLNQAQGDRAILAKQLNISPQQMKYVTHTEAIRVLSVCSVLMQVSVQNFRCCCLYFTRTEAGSNGNQQHPFPG